MSGLRLPDPVEAEPYKEQHFRNLYKLDAGIAQRFHFPSLKRLPHGLVEIPLITYMYAAVALQVLRIQVAQVKTEFHSDFNA